MVWRSSTTFGVGKARTRSGKIIVVAMYKPAGNVLGEFHRNVLPQPHTDEDEGSVRHEQAAAAAEPSGVDWSAPLSPSAHPSPNLCDETPARTPRLRRGAGTSSNKPGYYPPKTRAAPSPACSASNRKAHSADDKSSFSRPSDARRLNDFAPFRLPDDRIGPAYQGRAMRDPPPAIRVHGGGTGTT
ncbi:hypothetical protein MRX96_032394 [Rhipicephalus microplus]